MLTIYSIVLFVLLNTYLTPHIKEKSYNLLKNNYINKSLKEDFVCSSNDVKTYPNNLIWYTWIGKISQDNNNKTIY